MLSFAVKDSLKLENFQMTDHVQYRSNVSYHLLARNETCIARNETRIAKNETRLAGNENCLARNFSFLASALQVPLLY